jgi:general stress protein YciG
LLITLSSEGIPMKGKRGFASMDPARRREIASMGGKAAHAKGTAHEWSSEEAKEAGRKRAHMRGGRPRKNPLATVA